MKTRVGMWIDHRKAVIVTVTKLGQETMLISSNVEKQLRPLGGMRSKTPYGAQDAQPDDMRERESQGHLNVYFDKVISHIRDAESILLFGPGEAKGELGKRIKVGRLPGKVVGVETVDKMTAGQVAAKVRQRFLVPGGAERRRQRGVPLHRAA